MDQDRHDRVRARAYELWEKEGQPEGRAQAHWEQAEREIDAEGGGVPEHAPPAAGTAETRRSAVPRETAGAAEFGSSTIGEAAAGPDSPKTPARRDDRVGAAARSETRKGGAEEPAPGQDNDLKRGGYSHADTTMGTSHSD